MELSNNSTQSLRNLLKPNIGQSFDLECILEYLGIRRNELNTFCISPDDDTFYYTPMQFGAKYGLVTLVKRLLQSDADPNLASERSDLVLKKKSRVQLPVQLIRQNSKSKKSEKIETKKKFCHDPPLLLAARYGHHGILKLLKYHNFSSQYDQKSAISNKEVDEIGDQFEDFITFSRTGVKANFRVTDSKTGFNVLHSVLQQPLLKDETKKGVVSNVSDNSSADRKQSTDKLSFKIFHLQLLSSGYKECINVLLDIDRFEEKNAHRNDYYPRQIRSIVNNQDNDGNTPLQHAVSNWPEAVIKKLLSLGANASIKNIRGDIPLRLICKSAFEDFLNKQCIIVDDFDPSDDEIEEDEDEDEEIKKVSQDYNPSFMMKICQAGKEATNEIKFDYSFLAPQRSYKSANNFETQDLESGGYSGENLKSSNPETSGKECLMYKPEMDLLWEMSQSEEHRPLITHPVFASFLWIKWKLMTRFFNRSLRLDFLFCFCVLWYIFSRFGGEKWNAVMLHRGNVPQSTIDTNSFCQPPSYKFEMMDFSTISGLEYSMTGYYLFTVIFLIQLALMIRDLRRDIALRISEDYRTASQSPIVAIWIDIVNLFLSILVMLGGKNQLWLVISVLLVFQVLTEMVQMTLMMTSIDFNYFKAIGNLLDIGIIVLVSVILYVPPSMISNPHIFSVLDTELSVQDEKDYEEINCKVLRCIAGLVIVLVSSRYLMSISKLPRFKSYNLYVIMFYRVLTRYVQIMIWYSFYLIAFGLGFYIILHGDVKTKKGEFDVSSNKSRISSEIDEEEKNNKFRNPFLALVKTTIMFVGEFEYSDFQITGGDISVTMTYLFLLLFTFLMIIVLVNLLNGLAVSDTKYIMRDSVIENQVSFINTIRFFESLYIGQMQRFINDSEIEEDHSSFKKFFHHHIVPKGILLFHSPYLRDGRSLAFPLRKQTASETKFNTMNSYRDNNRTSDSLLGKIRKWVSMGVIYENVGSEEFLNDARNIMIHERSLRVESRRQKVINKRNKEMRKEIKEIRKHIFQSSSGK